MKLWDGVRVWKFGFRGVREYGTVERIVGTGVIVEWDNGSSSFEAIENLHKVGSGW